METPKTEDNVAVVTEKQKREPLPLFRLANMKRQRSKFEINGDDWITTLEDMRENLDKRLHWYQIEAVLSTKHFFETKVRRQGQESDVDPALIVAPTGSGKSGMIVLLPYVLKSRKVLIITPSKVIGEQLGANFGEKGFQKCFFNVAELATNEEDVMEMLESVLIVRNCLDFVDNITLPNLVIVNAQKFGGKCRTSLMYGNEEMINNVRKVFGRFDTLIVDEAHHYPAKTWRKIVDEFQRADTAFGMRKKIIFLTATPYRMVKKGVKKYILPEQHIAFTVTQQMVQGITTRFDKFFELSREDEETCLTQKIRDIFNQQMAAEPRHRFPQAMILVRTKIEAVQVATELNLKSNEDNFAVPIFTGEAGKENLKQFNQQRHRVAVTCGLLLEGYDNSNVSICFIKRNVQSRLLFNQFIGRCIRKLKLDSDVPDQTVATVMSYEDHKQRKLWDEREMDVLAEDDPDVDDVDVLDMI